MVSLPLSCGFPFFFATPTHICRIMISNLEKISDKSSTKVIAIEAKAGKARRDYLQRWLDETTIQGAISWLLICDRKLDGPWAGLKDLLSSIVTQVQEHSPDLILKHDYELTCVLPALRRVLSVRYPNLTDIATQQEQIRNYPADRAFRIIHGIIDFLTAWYERSQSQEWVIACDCYDMSGGLVRIFFSELMRRKGNKLNIKLLVTISPDANQSDVIGKFDPKIIKIYQLDLPANLIENLTIEEMILLANELKEQIKDDPIEQEINLPRLIFYLESTNQLELAVKYQVIAAHIYNRKGYYEDGLAFAQDALNYLKQNCPDDIDQRWMVDSMLYTSYIALDKPQDALDAIQSTMQKLVNPDDLFRAYFMLAMLYIRALQERDIERAELYLDKGLNEISRSLLSDDIKLFQQTFNRNGMALVRHRQGRYKEAVDLCQWCFKQINKILEPKEHLLYRSILLYNIAQIYDFVGNYPEAINFLSDALSIDPNYSEYYNIRGNLFFKMENYNAALEDYLKAIELSAPYPEVWANMGQCYRRLGIITSAIEAYCTALDLLPNQSSVLIARAQAMESLGCLENALEDYNIAISIDPNQPLILANRATLLYELSRLPEAIADLDKAISLDNENIDLYHNRAVTYMAMGRIDKAINDLRIYLSMCTDLKNYSGVEVQLRLLEEANSPL